MPGLLIWFLGSHCCITNEETLRVMGKIDSLVPGKFDWHFRYLIFQIKISVINDWGLSYELALRWMSLNLSDDKSTLVQVMAWCHQATSHYLSQCWPRSLSSYSVTRPQWVNMYQTSTKHNQAQTELIILDINILSSVMMYVLLNMCIERYIIMDFYYCSEIMGDKNHGAALDVKMSQWLCTQIAKFMGPTWGPSGVTRPRWPHVGPMNPGIRVAIGVIPSSAETWHFLQNWSAPWLLMSWLLALLGHQQQWYWHCRINKSLSSKRKDLNQLCHSNFVK